jgi:hypothetical protein
MKYVPKASLEMLDTIDVFVESEGRFPEPNDLCGENRSARGPIIRHFAVLEGAGFIGRNGHSWSTGYLTPEGIRHVDGVDHLTTVAGGKTAEELSRVHLRPSEELALYTIYRFTVEHERFPGPADVARELEGRVTNWNRAHMIRRYQRLEAEGFIARPATHHWDKSGRFTRAGKAVASKLRKPVVVAKKSRQTGGGLSPDGGTRHPSMLFSATPDNVLQEGDKHSKLGTRVSRASVGAPQAGLPIAQFSLEEGRTCSPACGLRDVCYPGKMSQLRRIKYEGAKTDRAVGAAILKSRPHHLRINVSGDFPTQDFVDSVYRSIEESGSTSFGYTHWQPEEELGGYIRALSDANWDRFAIRTSYEPGSRAPLLRRAAVTMERLDADLLREHNAVPCPENLQRLAGVRFKHDVNCGNCGLCWTLTERNIAFIQH